MDRAYREFGHCWALHEAAWFHVKEAGRWHSELKRKVDEAHTKTPSAERMHSSTTSDHVNAEEVLNNSVGL